MKTKLQGAQGIVKACKNVIRSIKVNGEESRHRKWKS